MRDVTGPSAPRHRIRPTTRAAYQHALAPLRQRHGAVPVQKLAKAHLDELVSDLAAGKCPGQQRKWGANSINPMLNLISAVLAGLVKQGVLVRDVAALVDRMPRPKQTMRTFTEAEVRVLLKHVEAALSRLPSIDELNERIEAMQACIRLAEDLPELR